ncbi:MFS transporter [Arthrobacter antibioticus]|uniref:MFS transporter n=1 Tax=Arthrobacter sp. H35-MC1 TaxID=3046203 RepID=UPI0024B96C4E|nr:MFS transporter [Arthrobacter sp. H35-MC1]MDJ0318690.1 MFS transporter [Arthrobacter sp. H35-MC1]
MTTTSTPVEKRTGVQTLTLIVISIAQFIIALDYSIVYVALPSIGAELAMNGASLQWVVSSYALLFAGLLLLGGRIVDKFGGKSVFIGSILLFGLSSLLGGIADNATLLLLARALQGIAASALLPSVLALLSQTFPGGKLRSNAYAIWGAVGASGLAAGVVLGGLLTTFSWRWTFLINIPLVIICGIGAVKTFRSKNPQTKPTTIPVMSSIAGTAAILLVVLTLTLLADPETSPGLFWSVTVLAILAVLAFLFNERRSDSPLIERPLRKLHALRAGTIAAGLYMASVGTEFFLVTLYLQEQRGYSALAAGIAFLPLAAMVTAGNVVAGKLIVSNSVQRVLGLGFAISAGGLLLLAVSLGIDNFWLGLLPGFLLSGFGHGLIYTAMFVLGTSDAPQESQGAAGSLITTSQYVAGGISLALLVLVIALTGPELGYPLAFGINAAFALIGVVVALTLKVRSNAT